MDKYPRVRVAGILEKDNKILFVKHKKKLNEYWLLPGGGVDYGEEFEQSLIREFIEETNLKVKVKKILFISESIAPDLSRHIINIVFLVEYISGELKVGDEEILCGVEFLEIDKIDDYIIYPNIKEELKDYFDSGITDFRYLGNRWE